MQLSLTKPTSSRAPTAPPKVPLALVEFVAGSSYGFCRGRAPSLSKLHA